MSIGEASDWNLSLSIFGETKQDSSTDMVLGFKNSKFKRHKN